MDDLCALDELLASARVGMLRPAALEAKRAAGALVVDIERRVILVCNEGYQSSLAAATLRRLGVNATDLIGGYQSLSAIRMTPAPRS